MECYDGIYSTVGGNTIKFPFLKLQVQDLKPKIKETVLSTSASIEARCMIQELVFRDPYFFSLREEIQLIQGSISLEMFRWGKGCG